MGDLEVIPGHARAEKLLRAAEEKLLVEFRAAETSFQHMGDRGAAREAAVRKFLADQLPTRFGVGAGEVMDASGNTSGQTDVLIYDTGVARPLAEIDGVALLPAEALLAVVEVKSSLNKAEVDKATAAAAKLRAVRPWDAPWTAPRRNGQHADDRMPRIFASLFAFQTDLVEATWATSELKRVRESCADSRLPTAHLDRVVVLGRGVLVPSAGTAFTAPDDASVIGQWFYQLASFLARESVRREPFPWDSYRLPRKGAWAQVAPSLDDAPVVARATRVDRLRARTKRNRRASKRVE